MHELSSPSRLVAGHAHTGVLMLPTLVNLLFVDGAALPDALKALGCAQGARALESVR